MQLWCLITDEDRDFLLNHWDKTISSTQDRTTKVLVEKKLARKDKYLYQQLPKDTHYLGSWTVLSENFSDSSPNISLDSGEEFTPKRICTPRPTGTTVEITKDIPTSYQREKDELLAFINTLLEPENLEKLPRCDYKEFLELAKIFLGENIGRKKGYTYSLQRPGADHHARWMSKSLVLLGSTLLPLLLPLRTASTSTRVYRNSRTSTRRCHPLLLLSSIVTHCTSLKSSSLCPCLTTTSHSTNELSSLQRLDSSLLEGRRSANLLYLQSA